MCFEHARHRTQFGSMPRRCTTSGSYWVRQRDKKQGCRITAEYPTSTHTPHTFAFNAFVTFATPSSITAENAYSTCGK
eukprot:m.589172 g.589172  ORF g.589172 m.589172 type:complete len:78 (-) comp22369_c0_seq10:336-569(-)